MQLSGIAAELSPGAREKTVLAVKSWPLPSLQPGIRLVELAKGFEPPTL